MTPPPAMVAPVVDDRFLAEVVRRLLSAGEPLKIVLFGSHARGEGRADSDLDLLIIERPSEGIPPPSPALRATPYYMALGGLHPSKDIVVYTPPEIAQWAEVPMAFTTTALREGRVLYDAERVRRPGERLVRQG